MQHIYSKQASQQRETFKAAKTLWVEAAKMLVS